MATGIITLTTDYGLSDYFTGAVKGAILRIHPSAQIVDITHNVSSFAISEGGFIIAQTYPYFPVGTVHVVVVDPGVGGARRAILVEAAGQYFVAPDNGVLSLVFARENCRVTEITAEEYFVMPVSSTFHGRDIFAPVAAYLAKGVLPERFGKTISDYVRVGFHQPTRKGERIWSGCVLKIDHFGNIVTNFHVSEFPALGRRPFQIAAGTERVRVLTNNFEACPPGTVCAIAGSSGFFELVMNQESAAKKLNCVPGDTLELTVY